MTYTIKIIKRDSIYLWLIFVFTLMLIWICNSKVGTESLKIYFIADGIVFYLIYQVTCVANSTWKLDDHMIYMKGVDRLFSLKEKEVFISLKEISFYQTRRYKYFNKLELYLRNNLTHCIYMKQYGATETNYADFLKDLAQKLEKLKNT